MVKETINTPRNIGLSDNGVIDDIRKHVAAENANLPTRQMMSEEDVLRLYAKRRPLSEKVVEVLGEENVEKYEYLIRNPEVLDIDKLFLTESSFSGNTMLLYASQLDSIQVIVDELLELAEDMAEAFFRAHPIEEMLRKHIESRTNPIDQFKNSSQTEVFRKVRDLMSGNFDLDTYESLVGETFATSLITKLRVFMDLDSNFDLGTDVSLSRLLQEIFLSHVFNYITKLTLEELESTKKRVKGRGRKSRARKYPARIREYVLNTLRMMLEKVSDSDQYTLYYSRLENTRKIMINFAFGHYKDAETLRAENSELFSEIMDEMVLKSMTFNPQFTYNSGGVLYVLPFIVDRYETNRYAFIDRLEKVFSFSVIPWDAKKLAKYSKLMPNGSEGVSPEMMSKIAKYGDSVINMFSINRHGEIMFGQTNIPASNYFDPSLLEKIRNRIFKIFLSELRKQANILDDYYEFNTYNKDDAPLDIVETSETNIENILEDSDEDDIISDHFHRAEIVDQDKKSSDKHKLQKIKGLKASKVKRVLRRIIGPPKRIEGSHHFYEYNGDGFPLPFHGKDVPFFLLLKMLKKFGIFNKFCEEI